MPRRSCAIADEAPARGLDARPRLVAIRDIDGGHVRARFRERDRHRLPEALCRARDERAATVQPEVGGHQRSSFVATWSMSSNTWFSPTMPQMNV